MKEGEVKGRVREGMGCVLVVVFVDQSLKPSCSRELNSTQHNTTQRPAAN